MTREQAIFVIFALEAAMADEHMIRLYREKFGLYGEKRLDEALEILRQDWGVPVEEAE